MFKSETFEKILLQYIQARNILKSLGVAKNEKSIESQADKWFVAKLYDGQIEENPNNKDWDVIADGRTIQVKTHAKAASNRTAYTNSTMRTMPHALIIIVFTEGLKLKHSLKSPGWKPSE